MSRSAHITRYSEPVPDHVDVDFYDLYFFLHVCCLIYNWRKHLAKACQSKSQLIPGHLIPKPLIIQICCLLLFHYWHIYFSYNIIFLFLDDSIIQDMMEISSFCDHCHFIFYCLSQFLRIDLHLWFFNAPFATGWQAVLFTKNTSAFFGNHLSCRSRWCAVSSCVIFSMLSPVISISL